MRCLVFQRLMWANLIVKKDIFIHALSKVPFRSIFAPVGFLFFECGKECLCDRIIERRAACGKGLLNAILLQKFTKCCGNILPAPITVKGQTLRIASFCISSTESGCDKTGTGCAGYSIPDDFAGEEVNDSAKIDPCIFDFEVSNIAHPYLVWMIRGKFPAEQILLLSHLILVDLFCVGTNTVQAKFLHNGRDSFCADAQTAFGQNSTDLISAIPLFAIIEDLFYFQYELSLLGFIFATICTTENMIIFFLWKEF